MVKPNANTSPVLTVGYGQNMYEFNADLNAINQLKSVSASTWDYKTQKVINGKSSNPIQGPGNITSNKLSDVIGLKDYQLQSGGYMDKSALTEWTKAQFVKSDYAKIRGEVKFQGTNLVFPGDYLTLKGVGDRFNGNHLVSSITHDISDGNWMTEAEIGLPDTWFTEDPDIMSPPTSGLIPGARGLFNGTVKQIDNDPDNQFRVLVDIPLFDEKGKGIWARLANFYSTTNAGAFFMPEIGDEVVLGFINEDPRFPIILGSLYSSSKHKPASGLKPDKKNPKKAIVSKNGITIEFDDENKVLTLKTPKGNTAIFSDKDSKISIVDQNKNSMIMSSSGITIKSAKDINLQATGKVNIKGNQGVNIQSTAG